MNNVKTLANFENAKLENLTAVKGGSWTMKVLVMPITWTMEDEVFPIARKTVSSTK